MGGRLERDIRSLPGVLACAFEGGGEVVVLADPDADRAGLDARIRRVVPGSAVRILGGRELPRRRRAAGAPAGVAAMLGIGTAAAALVVGGWGTGPPSVAPPPEPAVLSRSLPRPLPSLFALGIDTPLSFVPPTVAVEIANGPRSAPPTRIARASAAGTPRAGRGGGVTATASTGGGDRVARSATGSRGRHLGHTKGKGHRKGRGKGHAHHRHDPGDAGDDEVRGHRGDDHGDDQHDDDD